MNPPIRHRRDLLDDIITLTAAFERPVTLMEVCGTHTMAIARSGLKRLLPDRLRLVSGPGCPVCVTPVEIIDYACRLAAEPDVVICSFGDMVRVPGSRSSLERYRPRIVYSCRDALEIASRNPQRQIVFFAVGFETTAPGIAATILEASRRSIKNFYILSALKMIPPALEQLARTPRLNIDGFILPGHVSAIIGEAPYHFLAQNHGIPSCITGFQPVEILRGIRNLLQQIRSRRPYVGNEYSWIARPGGNARAREIMKRVFAPTGGNWRGLGTIDNSSLALRHSYRHFDITLSYSYPIRPGRTPRGCRCAQVLLGVSEPADCPLFARECTPATPIGPCMVSSEGACAAHYAYGDRDRRTPPRNHRSTARTQRPRSDS